MRNVQISSNKVGLVSDMHFGIHQNSSMWHKIAADWAKWFRDELLKRDVRDVFIAGDIMHDRNEISVSTLHAVNNIFHIWKDLNITAIVGNHDAYYKDRSDVNSVSLLDGWDNVTVLYKPETISIFDRQICFCPWSTQYKDIPFNNDVIIGHFDISGFKMTKGFICSEGFQARELLEKTNLVISGHYHHRDDRDYKNGRILYIGCPYELTWSDTENVKGFYILNLEDLKTEFVQNNFSPKHKKVLLPEIVKSKRVTSSIKRIFKNNFIKLLISEDINPHKLDQLIQKLTCLHPLNIKVEFNLQNRYSVDDDGIEIEGVDIPFAIREFVNMLDTEYKEQIITRTLDLYREIQNEY